MDQTKDMIPLSGGWVRNSGGRRAVVDAVVATVSLPLVSEAPTGEEVAASQLLAAEQVAESAGAGVGDLTGFIEAGVIIPGEEGVLRPATSHGFA